MLCGFQIIRMDSCTCSTTWRIFRAHPKENNRIISPLVDNYKLSWHRIGSIEGSLPLSPLLFLGVLPGCARGIANNSINLSLAKDSR